MTDQQYYDIGGLPGHFPLDYDLLLIGSDWDYFQNNIYGGVYYVAKVHACLSGYFGDRKYFNNAVENPSCPF